MNILPIGKPTKPKVFHRHHRRTAEVMMAPELKTIVWMLEIMSPMMVIDVYYWDSVLDYRCRCTV